MDEDAPIKLDVASVSELEPGQTLGTGSFGRVKVCKHLESGTVFALKILQKEAIRQTRQEKNIMNEKELTSNLMHPFILHLYGTFQDRDCLYMMLEIVMGGELFRLLHGDGSVENKLSPDDTAFYAGNVASVYEYIHAQSVTYRDLKPENILIASDGYLKIVDWGFAKKVVDKTFTTCGTPEYLAPELVQGTGHNKGVDYWALGILIFEMLTGRTPFVGNDPDDTMAICRNIMNETIQYPEDFEESAADLIEGLCTREVLARLGCMKNGCADIKTHPFFASLNWRDLKAKRITAPWLPTVTGDMDVSNFDDIYDDEEEYIEPFNGNDQVFENF
jgi:serine/threonine protein kinase